MLINREELLNNLTKLNVGLSSKAIVEQTTHYLFTKDFISTYSGENCVIVPFKTGLECTIQADEFYKLISKIKQDKINLKLNENKIQIKAKGVNSELVVSTESDLYEIIENLQIEKYKKKAKQIPEDFIEAINLCSFSASKDMTNMVLTCININKDYIVSSDDLRISRYKLKNKFEDNFLLPVKSAIELVKFNPVKYALSESWIYFFTEDDVVFCSRIVSDEYPNVDEFFDFEGEKITFPENIVNSIDLASVMSEADFEIDKKIKIEIDGTTIKCKGEGDIGWVESVTESEMNLEAKISFSINPIFFAKIANKSTKVKISKDKALFIMDNFEHLIALYAVED